MSQRSLPWLTALVLLGLLVLPSRQALAHGLSVDVRREAGQILVHAAFGDGVALVGAQVVVRQAGEILAKGVTDVEGRWRQTLADASRDLLIEVSDGGGHLARVTLPAGADRVSSGRHGGTVGWRVALGLAIVCLLGLGLSAGQRWRGTRP